MPTIREIASLPDSPAKLSESALIMIDCQNTYRTGVMELEGVEQALKTGENFSIARAPLAFPFSIFNMTPASVRPMT